jgi:hypothetical protein
MGGAMGSRPRHGPPGIGDSVRILHLAGPEEAHVVGVEEGGRRLLVESESGEVTTFTLRRVSGLYVDDRWTRLGF